MEESTVMIRKRSDMLHIITTMFITGMLLMMSCLLTWSQPVLARDHSAPESVIQTQSRLVDVIPLNKYAHPYSKVLPACPISLKVPRCYSPLQMRQAYHIQPLIDAGITGKGQTIVIIDFYQSPNIRHDLHLFDQLFGLKDPHLTIYAPDGYGPFNANDPSKAIYTYETDLDVEWAHAIAPDADIALVLSRTPAGPYVYSATKFAIQNNLGSVISQSFGAAETSFTTKYVTDLHALFEQARAQGISVLAASGDSGTFGPISAKGIPNKIISLSPSVNYPASDPLVTGVGGTSLLFPTTAGQAKEKVWSNVSGATGGGFSRIFTRPAYQDGIADIGATRGVPDIAYDADPKSGVPVVISLKANQPTIVPIGGTSAGTPQWAGIIALGNQIAKGRLGFLNPALYTLAKNEFVYHRIFRDIVTGNNNFTLKGPENIPILGYSAHNGWDAATGLGTPIAAQLLKELININYDSDKSTYRQRG